MNEILNENYYVVHGWIKNQLGLKGIKKDIYAIIYGYSQDGESEFKGSVKYLVEWLDCSRPTVINALQDLTESGLITKRVEIINGVQFNRYKVNFPIIKPDGGSKKILQGVKKFDGGSKNFLPNKENSKEEKNIIINNNTKKDAEKVLSYLNEKANKHYKTIESNLKFITARLKDYSEIELKAVIDKKVKEWKGTEMEKYLRPETLFNATEFESYLNAPLREYKGDSGQHFESERNYSREQLDALLDDINNCDF